MTDKPKIVFVTTALLSPPHIGCMQRTVNICRCLAMTGQVTMLAVSHRFDERSVELCKNEFPSFYQIRLGSYDEYPPLQGAFKLKWDMHWPFSHGIQADAAGQKLFAHLIETSDLVWFHTLGAAFPFSKQTLPCRSVMDLDDINHLKYTLRSRWDSNFRFRCSAQVQALKWKRHEYRAVKTYDIVAVCSEQDRRYLNAANVRVIPNGFTASAKPHWQLPNPFRIGFIGTLGYGPNYDGLVWFRDNVWPDIRRRKPQMELRIVGSPPPLQYRVEADGFTQLGYIADPADEIKSWSALIVPIHYGGGTRIKILEAFSRLCPVVATSVGAQGIDVTDGKDILLADNPRRFADCCLELSENPERGRLLAQAGWELFEQKYTWDKIAHRVRQVVEEAIVQR
ncbi:MAG TPA: glycosyltransferase family 4 protein [Anaerohalosphaeraceae bacterium]|nr:glycosyltransferase [Phycisphaerae bacterium]HOK95971.1 glycosyltransferase family 4 protein [Anaerohalosphaeraceae bacterium]HOL30482.1 glycosyltransferase family 4 protein [Anaerohalosphaeraceae bacterium]HPC63928.1 glycosyltransferase family 4 protein [Anaerohalosphaeraceae bacterium]HPO69331.1 glycosyltransferase family 4 protein [Anaerohalosphaeraceae bacterium]